MEPSRKRRARVKRSLLDLPNELIFEIFRLTPLSTAAMLSLTCSRVYEISCSPLVWKERAQRFVRLDPAVIPAVWKGRYHTHKDNAKSSLVVPAPPNASPDDPVNTDVDPEGRTELLDFLYHRFGCNWKVVCHSFCPKPNLWGPLSKLTHVPVVASGDCGNVKCSKIAGTPFLSTGEAWPVCKSCNRPMQFWFQLYFSPGDPVYTVPGAARLLGEDNMLQFFMCGDQEGNCETWEMWSGDCICARMLKNVSNLTPQTTSSLLPIVRKTKFEARRILGFSTSVEYPGAGDVDPLVDVLTSELGEDWYEEEETDNGRFSYGGEKLFGWPQFVQSDETPDCPKCQRRMTMIFQLGSEGLFDYMFGDCGIGHIFQCLDCHLEDLPFGWACS